VVGGLSKPNDQNLIKFVCCMIHDLVQPFVNLIVRTQSMTIAQAFIIIDEWKHGLIPI